METALIGLAGVVLGLVISEVFRRRNRVEYYSQRLFDRRLEAHEGLFRLVSDGATIAFEVMEDASLGTDERHARISSAIQAIAEHTDANPILIDPYFGAHMTALLMGAEDVLDIEGPVEREAEKMRIQASIRDAKQMILAESGAAEITRHFRQVAKSRPTSPIIERIKTLEREYGSAPRS